MLNLSDKDLDHLSREAAQEHDPGDILGPRSWDKLEIRLDRDLGRVSPNTPRSIRGIRGIRRLPFYYAPAVVLLLGVSYYFIRQNRAQKGESSGSPPLTSINPGPAVTTNPSSSSQNPEHTDKSNSTPATSSATAQYPGPSEQEARKTTGQSSGQSVVNPASTAAAGSASSAGSAGSADRSAGNTDRPTGNTAATGAANPSATPGTTNSSLAARTTGPSLNAGVAAFAHNAHNNKLNHNHTANRHNKFQSTKLGTTPSGQDAAAARQTGTDRPTGTDQQISTARQTGSAQPSGPAQSSGSTHELALSRVRGPLNLKHSASINDSALRAFNPKTSVIQLAVRKGSLHINRSLEFGLVIAPDFSSVNSVAGDKAGSTIGLTVDYQFASHWYVGTGLLITRKNFAANPENYHVPPGYYSSMGVNNVDLVKGSFNMLEIPLNLRYDFSYTGNTMFFATAGVSSYVRTSENCNYYYSWFGREFSRGKEYPNQPNYMFSAINLSVGVETGISNSLSLLIAPYVKIPSRNIGFGQVELSSVGINFALKFAPVISRKRR